MSAAAYESVRRVLHARVSPQWSEDRLRRLVDDHEKGLRFGEIAKGLGGFTTKNACIGMARRLGLPPRDRDSGYTAWAKANSAEAAKRRGRKAEERRAKAVARATVPPEPPRAPRPHVVTDPSIIAALALPGLAPVRISDLSSHQCLWPVGDPKDRTFSFCGRLKGPSGPYCAAHGRAAVDARATARAMKSGPDKLARLAGPLRGSWRAA